MARFQPEGRRKKSPTQDASSRIVSALLAACCGLLTHCTTQGSPEGADSPDSRPIAQGDEVVLEVEAPERTVESVLTRTPRQPLPSSTLSSGQNSEAEAQETNARDQAAPGAFKIRDAEPNTIRARIRQTPASSVRTIDPEGRKRFRTYQLKKLPPKRSNAHDHPIPHYHLDDIRPPRPIPGDVRRAAAYVNNPVRPLKREELATQWGERYGFKQRRAPPELRGNDAHVFDFTFMAGDGGASNTPGLEDDPEDCRARALQEARAFLEEEASNLGLLDADEFRTDTEVAEHPDSSRTLGVDFARYVAGIRVPRDKIWMTMSRAGGVLKVQGTITRIRPEVFEALRDRSFLTEEEARAIARTELLRRPGHTEELVGMLLRRDPTDLSIEGRGREPGDLLWNVAGSTVVVRARTGEIVYRAPPIRYSRPTLAPKSTDTSGN